MSNIYVSSVDGSDADNGTTWALAKQTIAGALAIAVNNDVIFVDSAHNYSASAAIAWNAASGANIAIISVNRNGSTTTGHSGWLAGATETMGTSGNAIDVAGTGAQNLYLYGITLNSHSTSSSSNAIRFCFTAENARKNVYCDTCTFNTPTTNSNEVLLVGQNVGSAHSNSNVTFRNCAFVIRNSVSLSGVRFNNVNCEMIHCTFSYAGASKPAYLFGSVASGSTCRVRIIDCDLSGYEKSGGGYVGVDTVNGAIELINCKLHATPSITVNSWSNNAGSLTLINVDSGDTKTVFEYRNRLGTLTENTSIYANAGAQMNATSLSWEIVTTSACNEMEPFVTPWLHAWGDSTSAQNAGFRLIHDSATNLHNRNCWAEAEYVSDASFPKGTLASSRNATPFDGSSLDLSSDSETWTGTGGFSNPNKQKVDLNFTPAEKSLLRGRLSVGVASKTLYVAPQLWLS